MVLHYLETIPPKGTHFHLEKHEIEVVEVTDQTNRAGQGEIK
jgi:Mg2+/Co2+ transporter CorB